MNRISKELRFDGGLTATSTRMFDDERRCRFTNGSGDDVADAVEWALQFADEIGSDDVDEFSDPLDVLLSEEEDDDMK